jgi:hypothetical protein
MERFSGWSRSPRMAVLLLLGLALLLALPTLTYPLGRDQGEFATIARGLLMGRVPYIDMWNPKPPAIFVVYAAAMALLGQTAPALRVLDFPVVLFSGLALYGIGRRIGGRAAGLWAALLLAVFYFTETFWTLTQNDGVVLVPMTAAAYAVLRIDDATGVRRGLWALAAGALCGLSVWFKYPFALFGAALAFGWLLAARPVLRDGLRLGGAFIVGGAALLLAGVLPLLLAGALPEFIRSAQVTSQYTALTFNLADFAALMSSAIGYRWNQWGLLGVLALAWPLFRRGVAWGATWRLVLLWLLAGMLIMLSQAKGYDYHWLPMLPPLALLAGDTLARLIGRIGQGRRWVVIAVALGLYAVLIAGIWPQTWDYLSEQEDAQTYAGRFVAGEFRADESLQVVDYLQARVVRGDSLYIWGFRPEVYYLSGLLPATRFIFQFPLVGSWYPPEWREENADILWAALPPYVLVLQLDYMPWVTGSHEDSNTLLQQYADLNDWLVYNYERDTQIGNFFVWRRKS